MISRYKNTKVENNGKSYATFNIPIIEESESDVYIVVREGDRLDSLAWKYYKNQNLWWIIARANQEYVNCDSIFIEPGLRIRIPANCIDILSKL